MKTFVIVRDRFSDMHSWEVQPDTHPIATAVKLVTSLGLNDSPGEDFRVGTVEAEDAGAARLARYAITWLGSFQFEADGIAS